MMYKMCFLSKVNISTIQYTHVLHFGSSRYVAWCVLNHVLWFVCCERRILNTCVSSLPYWIMLGFALLFSRMRSFKKAIWFLGVLEMIGINGTKGFILIFKMPAGQKQTRKSYFNLAGVNLLLHFNKMPNGFLHFPSSCITFLLPAFSSRRD